MVSGNKSNTVGNGESHDSSIWPIPTDLAFLNHGSFGSCPRPVLEYQAELRDRMEKQPVIFFVNDLENLIDQARDELSRFIGCKNEDLVFVQNATTGINTVLRSLKFQSGDELLVCDHEYNACRNAMEMVAGLTGSKVVVVEIPFPLSGEDEIISRILDKVNSRTRLVMLDHISSQTGIRFPIEKLVKLFNERGIETLIDGAHAPGMIPLNISELNPTYYTANCHKWLCSPKGAGFLYVDESRQIDIRPLNISHGANSKRANRSRFQIEFGWTGTWDPTAYLTVPKAISFLEDLVPGGWSALMKRNHELVLEARKLICQALEMNRPCPDSLIGSIASFPLPDGSDEPSDSPLYSDPMQQIFREKYSIEVPIIPWPAPPHRLLRISAQYYNSLEDYQRLSVALKELFRK